MRNLLLFATLATASCSPLIVRPSEAYPRVQIQELKFNDNFFRVTASLRVPSTAQDITDMADQFALLKSAETARRHGYSYFTIVRRSASKGDECFAVGLYASTCIGTDYSVSNTILCFKEPPPIDKPIYEVARVIDSVSSKYGLLQAVVAR
jgi:hypothetical protein